MAEFSNSPCGTKNQSSWLGDSEVLVIVVLLGVCFPCPVFRSGLVAGVVKAFVRLFGPLPFLGEVVQGGHVTVMVHPGYDGCRNARDE